MRLEPLCTITMRYSHGSWHRPYGPDAQSGAEGACFGQVVWASYPRRREDGGNEEAHGPPSLGAEPPARFRQRGSAL